MRTRNLLAGLMLGSALAVGGFAMPAQAASLPATQSLPPECDPWDTDNYTYGASCNTSRAYYAKVKCANGSSTKYARGATTSRGNWSYAYCSAFGPGWVKVGGTGGIVWQ
ncbi:hypothetical protein ACFU3J_08680 [Streptomyces sp. NPDC057411]|uniref:hypothetical protein n=1 Tax=unclassified Streptomyces TaxID=2593676 RepID=UPI00362BA8CC